MVELVNPELLPTLRKYGAFDISACFNCGNCTSVCQLTGDPNNFPRRLIRYGQLGMQDRLLAAGDLWMCYNCGDCTATCPREADPAGFMGAARRYAIAHYDPTGLARLYYRSTVARIGLFLLLSLLFTFLLLWHRGGMNGRRLSLFDFVPGHVVHDVGVGIFVLIGLAACIGTLSMAYRVLKARDAWAWRGWGALLAAVRHACSESLGLMRYQQCDADKADRPWYVRPWFIHATILWGFLAMLAATTLDYLFKEIGSYVPPWYPTRLLGTIGGGVCLYGLAMILYRRYRQEVDPYKSSRFDDWFFPTLLAVTVMTGLGTLLVVYLPPTRFAYVLFLVHVVLAMDLLVLLPITKFAHAVYRPLALGMDYWAKQPAPQPAVPAKTES